MSLFEPKILNAINQIKQKKKRPDLNTISVYLIETKASNAVKQLIETILGNLIEANIIENTKRFRFVSEIRSRRSSSACS